MSGKTKKVLNETLTNKRSDGIEVYDIILKNTEEAGYIRREYYPKLKYLSIRSRDDGPAIKQISKRGESRIVWMKNNIIHREGGPAQVKVIRDEQSRNLWNKKVLVISLSWYDNGKLHREDGPAIKKYTLSTDLDLDLTTNKNKKPVKSQVHEIYYLQGVRLSKYEWKQIVNKMKFELL